MSHVLEFGTLFVWAALWGGGGWLLAISLFRLRPGEQALVGIGLGLILQVWLSNALAHAIPAPAAFWLSPALVFAGGIASALRFRAPLRIRPSLEPLLLLGILILLFNAIGRGLGIFDDYQNLPTVSLMAAGDVPPHFALDPALRFGYHYLLLLFAAQLMRIGNLFPWGALDLARGVSLALPMLLAGAWARRLTGSRPAAFLTACVLAFAGGSRWLLLLLPPSWLAAISQHVKLIGSAASSAPSLSQAMVSSWKIDGAGPMPFPFAFYSGVNQPYVMAYTGIAGSAILILLLLLLTAERWRHWSAAAVTIVLLGSLAIANEIAFLLLGMGMLIVAAMWLLRRRRPARMNSLPLWIGIMAAAAAAATLQGGMLTEIIRGWIERSSAASSYFDTSPVWVWPPQVVSAHLGPLSLADPAQLVGALLEIGPIVLVTPLVIAWSRKSLRLGRWFEVSLLASALGAVLALFVSFRGPLFTATPRLMGSWFFVTSLYAVPLLGASFRRRGETWKALAAAGGLTACLGGVVLFGISLMAIQKPVYATFITPMDAEMSQSYWNRLRPGALVFDPVPFRAPTVFGRFTRSSPSWYTRSPDWQALADAPDPFKLRAAGFEFVYFDSDYLEGLSEQERQLFADPCVKLVGQVDGIHSERDYTKDFRRLLDIAACAP